jgi:copper(I)-binding protein
MKMESDGYGGKIMKMRKIKNPQIIANKPFILKPGADHLMFFGMGESIKKGKDIPLKFIFLDKQKLIEKTITFSVI